MGTEVKDVRGALMKIAPITRSTAAAERALTRIVPITRITITIAEKALMRTILITRITVAERALMRIVPITRSTKIIRAGSWPLLASVLLERHWESRLLRTQGRTEKNVMNEKSDEVITMTSLEGVVIGMIETRWI